MDLEAKQYCFKEEGNAAYSLFLNKPICLKSVSTQPHTEHTRIIQLGFKPGKTLRVRVKMSD